MRQRFLPLLFLANGIYSLLSLQRDFQSTKRLTIYLFLLIPVFISFGLAYRWYESHKTKQKSSRLQTAFHWVGRAAVQSLTQYILMFCLPFFSVSERWVYLSISLGLLASTLWVPWWNYCLQWWAYRRCIQVWSLLCAVSFLFPFLWPERLSWFYPSLAAAGLLALIPARLKKTQMLGLGGLAALLLIGLLALPMSWRFPMLSVWLQKPHFETDTQRKDSPHPILGKTIQAAKINQWLAEGHSLCCVAPVVAPPTLREKIQQEWTLDGQLIEAPELNTSIAGSSSQKAFRSYYCKKKFPPLLASKTLRCRLFLQKQIYLGGSSLRLN